jgi:hypothetical protein
VKLVNNIKLVFLIFFLQFSTISFAEWEGVMQSNEMTYYVDMDTAKKTGDIVNILSIVSYNAPVVSG